MSVLGIGKIDLSYERRSIPIERILPDIGQPRRRYEQHALEELTESFREHGQISFPLVESITGTGYMGYVDKLSDIDEEDKKHILKNVNPRKKIFLPCCWPQKMACCKKCALPKNDCGCFAKASFFA